MSTFLNISMETLRGKLEKKKKKKSGDPFPKSDQIIHSPTFMT